MKSVFQQSCELLVSDLREKIYVEQKLKRNGKKHVDVDIVFDIKQYGSSSEKGLTQLHLICYDRAFPSSFMYLAEVVPTTGEWKISGSQFKSSVERFVSFCLEELESRQEKDPIRSGLALAEIATKEFSRLMG